MPSTVDPLPPLRKTHRAVANAVNFDGVAVGFSSMLTGIGWYPVYWEGSRAHDLPMPIGCDRGIAYDINRSGIIVGTAMRGPTTIALLWPTPGRVVELPPLVRGYASGANAVNDAGDVAGSSAIGPTRTVQACLWDEGAKPVHLGTLGGQAAGARDIANSRRIVGWSELPGSSSNGQAFEIGRGKSMTMLPGLSAQGATALACNGAGDVVGEALDASRIGHATLWRAGVVTDLGALAGDYSSSAYDVNSEGIIVGESKGPTGARAFMYRRGYGMRDLNARVPRSGWRLSSAQGINEQNWVVGEGTDPQGRAMGFLLRP